MNPSKNVGWCYTCRFVESHSLTVLTEGHESSWYSWTELSRGGRAEHDGSTEKGRRDYLKDGGVCRMYPLSVVGGATVYVVRPYVCDSKVVR